MSEKYGFQHWLIFLLISLSVFLGAEEPLRIAILPFQNLTSNRELDAYEQAIPEIMVINLSECKLITLVERTRLKEILDEMQLALSGVINEDKAVEIGEISGANAILMGSITVAEDVYRINARLVDVSSSEIILTGMKDWLSDDEIIRGVDDLSEQIIYKLTGEVIDISPEFQYEPLTVYDDQVLSMETALDQPVWLNGSGEPVTLQVDIYSKEVPHRKRIPLNLALVIDRSGSMASERKLDYVKNSARFIIQNMTAEDVISLVCYASKVKVVAPAQSVKQKQRLIDLVGDITPGGSTNLSGGMLEGFSQVAKNLKAGQVNRVLLLSDGLANEGVTQPAKLQEICYEKSLQKMSISTFGVGADFDEDLLLGLAKLGVGNYYFIHSPEEIPTIFAGEMSGLLAIAAQNVNIEIQTAPGVTVGNVFGYLSETNQNLTKVPVGDIFSNEHYSITFELNMPVAITDSLLLAEVILHYDDVINKGNRIQTKSTVYIQSTTDSEDRDYYRNPYVRERLTLLNSSLLLQSTMQQADIRNLDEVQQSLQKQVVEVATVARELQSTELKKQILTIHKYSQQLAEVAEKSKMADKFGPGSQEIGSSAGALRLMQKSVKYDSYQLQKQNKSQSEVYQLPKEQQRDDSGSEEEPASPVPLPPPKIPPTQNLQMRAEPQSHQTDEQSKSRQNEVRPALVPVDKKKTKSQPIKTVTPPSRKPESKTVPVKAVEKKPTKEKPKKPVKKAVKKKPESKDTKADQEPGKPDLKK